VREYNRNTRECSFSDLRPELAEAIKRYTAKYELGRPEVDAIACCETASERIKKGLFGKGGEIQYTGVVLTPKLLIWALTAGRSDPIVTSASLRDVEVKEYKSNLIEDSGVDIFGFLTGSAERSSAFIGLSQNDSGQRFRQALFSAVEQAHTRA